MPTIQLTFIASGAACPLIRFNIGLFGRYRLSLTGYAYNQTNATHAIAELVSPQLTLGVQVTASSSAVANYYGGSNFRLSTTNGNSIVSNVGKELELNTVLLQGYIEAQFLELSNNTLIPLTNFSTCILYIHAEPLDTYTTQNLLN